MLTVRKLLPLLAICILSTPTRLLAGPVALGASPSALPLQPVFEPLQPLPAPLQEEEPQAMFRWAQAVEDLGTVSLPVVGQGGWTYGPNGMYYRAVPSFSGDPTYELLFRPPFSGSATHPERVLVQIPAGFASKPFYERAVVMAFHRFSVSEKDIFLNTTLPQEARQRGWMLVAPYGLTDTNFGNVQSQESLATIAHALFAVVPFNYRRIYGVGFSMGGINALSFGMRHLDGQQMQFAAVAVHTGTMDMVQTFNNSGLAVQLLLSNSKHFGGTPSQVPFEYERVSPVRFLPSGLVDPDHAPVVNFEKRAIYLHSNLADPQTNLVAGMSSLRQFLQQRGANVLEDLVYEPTLGHNWATMNMTKALDFLGQDDLSKTMPDSQDFVVDTPGRWWQVEVDTIEPDKAARFHLDVAPYQLGLLNSFNLSDTDGLYAITLDLPKIGLSSTQPLRFTHSTVDGTYDWITLRGVPFKPSSVRANGAPPATWNFNPFLKELRIVPHVTGALVTVDILP